MWSQAVEVASHWLPRSKAVEGSRATSRIAARASSAVGACILWVLIGAAEDGLCGESQFRAQASESSQTRERNRAEALAPVLVAPPRAELNAAQSTAEATSTTLRQALDQERARADALAGELATLRAELETARVAGKESAQAIEVGIRQTQALEQERDKTIDLMRELAFLRTELDAARIVISKAVQATEAEIEQEQALEQQERWKADAPAHDLASLRAELDTVRIAASDAAKATAAEIEQKQALEQQLKQQQDGTEALKRELISLRTELDAARAATPEAARIVEAAKIEQERASAKERSRTEAVARELSSARQQIEEHASRLAAAHAEVLRVTEASNTTAAEQKRALASGRERADTLVQELALVKNQLEARNQQLAAVSASQTLASRQPAPTGRNEGAAEPRAKTTEGKSALPQWASTQAVASYAASYAERSSVLETPPQARSTAREAVPSVEPKVPVASEATVLASVAPYSVADEQRLLVRANALLRQADISGARPLLEHALGHGSARAAFMLAETYDARVLKSWSARGVLGDSRKALELYEKAQAGGIEDAKARIESLK
jgi:hypothetical protein